MSEDEETLFPSVGTDIYLWSIFFEDFRNKATIVEINSIDSTFKVSEELSDGRKLVGNIIYQDDYLVQGPKGWAYFKSSDAIETKDEEQRIELCDDHDCDEIGCFDDVPDYDDKETNEDGGTQTKVPYAFHLMPPQALLEVAGVLKRGAETYGEGNWSLIPEDEHINHAVGHLYRYLSGDRSEQHLTNAACRLLFALELSIGDRY